MSFTGNKENLPKELNVFLSKFEKEFGDTEFIFSSADSEWDDSRLYLYPKLDIGKWMKGEYVGHPQQWVQQLSKIMTIQYLVSVVEIKYLNGEEELKELMDGLNECIKNNNYKEWVHKIYLVQNKETGKPIVKVMFYTEADLETTSDIILGLQDCRNKMGYKKPGIIDFT